MMIVKMLPLILESAAVMALIWSPHNATAQVSAPIPSLPLLDDLHLTTPQQQQLRLLRLNTQARLNEGLTPNQCQDFLATLLRSRDLLTALVAMQLSVNQQLYLIDILSDSRKQVQNILTPDQQAYLDQEVHGRVQAQQFPGILARSEKVLALSQISN